MRYALLNHYDESEAPTLAPEEMQARMGRFIAFTQALAGAGILRDAQQLTPTPTATTIRVRDGEALLHDGPYAELKESFGGWWVLEVDDLDAALVWAQKCPGAEFGAIEVRPLVDLGQG